MPPKFETHLKGVLITCVGLLASSLGVFVSILSVIVSPLFSLFSTSKPIFIGEGKTGPTPRFQHPSQRIHPRHIRPPSSDKSSSRSSNTLSSNDTAHSIYSNQTTGSESRRTPSPNGTRFRDNTSESLIPSRSSTPGPIPAPSPPSQPRSPRNGLRTYLGMRKRSALLDEPTPEEPGPTTGADEPDPDQGSHEWGLGQAEIIVSPPTPSSSVFLHSAPGRSEVRFGNVSTPGKPAARFVKSHSKRHSLSSACPRKRRSCKRSSNPSTPKSASPATTPVVESKWHIAMRASRRKKRKSLRIDPSQGAASPVLIESGGVVDGEMIHEEPISINRPPVSKLPLIPARQAPVRTRPYEAPYFFPIPGSPEAIGYAERVREERRSVFVHPDGMLARNKKDLKRPSTIFSLEKDGTAGISKLRGEGSHDQVPEDSGKKRSKCTLKGSGDRNPNSSPSIPVDEFGVQVGTPTKLRKASDPTQSPPSPDTTPPPTTSSRPRAQRQGSQGIMRILGKR